MAIVPVTDQEQGIGSYPMGIQHALVEAMKQAAATGIAKRSKANLGGSNINFRGIEAAMNVMVTILIKCGITVTPSYRDLQITDRIRPPESEGKWTRCVTLLGTFTFTAMDGSSVTATAYGEANDTGDKAVTKAQSVSFRTVLFQQFVVPTMAIDPEDTDDDDDPMLVRARNAAALGSDAYKQFYLKEIGDDVREWLGDRHAGFKAIAAAADAKAAADAIKR